MIILPNFKEWANHITDREELEESLRQAFTQGLSLGRRQGAETGWQTVWDEEYKGFTE